MRAAGFIRRFRRCGGEGMRAGHAAPVATGGGDGFRLRNFTLSAARNPRLDLPDTARSGKPDSVGSMRRRGIAVAAVAAAALTAAPAQAAVRIANDRGGQIGQYLQNFSLLASSGERVVVDGNCLSACTLLLGIIPRERLCATQRARFGFHAAWLPDSNGRPITSVQGTRALWETYPSAVRRWILRHGGLSQRMIFLQGRELHAFVPSCEPVEARRHPRATRQVRSRHRPDIEKVSAADRR